LTIFSNGVVNYSNITLTNCAKMGNSNAVYADNRPDRGFNLGARQLFMTNVLITGGAPSPSEAMFIQNGTSNGALLAIPGTITNFNYDPALWPKIKDNVPNIYIGGTEGSKDTVKPTPPDTGTITPSTAGVFLNIGRDTITLLGPSGERQVYIKTKADTVKPTPPSLPTAPTNFAVTASTGAVLLTWSAPTTTGGTILNYKIYRGTAPGKANLIKTTGGNVFGYEDGNKTSGTTYYYFMSAVNGQGESPTTEEKQATPQ
jgi:hypothetical protein